MTFGYSSSKRRGRGLFGWVLFIGLVIMLLVVLQQNRANVASVSLNEFNQLLENGKLHEIELSDTEAVATVPGGYATPSNQSRYDRVRVALPTGLSGNWEFVQRLMEHADVRVDQGGNLLMNLLLPLVPWLLIFAFIWFFVFRHIRRPNAPAV